MARIVIIEAGRTFPELARRWGDFGDWVRDGLGAADDEVRLVAAFAGAPLPAPQETAAVVVTGSHAMVTNGAAWSEQLTGWLAAAAQRGLPLLGICYGHQLLARVLGGTVGDLPGGREIGSLPLRLTAAGRRDPLLGCLPPVFTGQLFHRQSVLALPAGARLLAASRADPHQAFAVGEGIWGVQFHPEFSPAVMQAYIEREEAGLLAEGLDPAGLAAAVQESPCGAVLRRFYELVKAPQRVAW